VRDERVLRVRRPTGGHRPEDCIAEVHSTALAPVIVLEAGDSVENQAAVSHACYPASA